MGGGEHGCQADENELHVARKTVVKGMCDSSGERLEKQGGRKAEPGDELKS